MTPALITPAQWVQIIIEVVLLGGAFFVIRCAAAKLEKQQNKFGEMLHSFELRLKDCVTWEELSREMKPVRTRLDQQGEKLTRLEVRCEEHHRGDG